MPTLAFALLLALSPAQRAVADLPFELVGNHIYLQGETDGRPISLMLDSGAGISVMDMELADRWKLPTQEGNLQVSGAGANRLKAKILTSFKVKLKGTDIERAIQVAIPLSPLSPLEGRPIEAVLGYDFFQKYVVNIDYANRRVRLFDPMLYAYSGAGKAIPFRVQGNHPHLDAEIEIPGVGKIPVDAMIDTGASSGVNLTGKIVQAHKLDELLPKTPRIFTGAGVGGLTFGRAARLQGISFGGFRFDRPVASLDLGSGGATGTGAGYDVLIGGEVMRRFNVTFDYSRKIMYLEPNADFANAFHGDQYGFLVKSEGEKLRTYRIMWITEGTPAKEVGLQVGDRLVEVDGKPAEAYELYEIKKLLRVPHHTLQLVIERNGEMKSLKITGRPLV